MKAVSKAALETIGEIALLKRMIETLAQEVAELRNSREHDAQKIRFLTSQIERVEKLPEVLSPKEAAKALGVSDKTLWNYKNAGLIEFVAHPGSRVTYRREHIERFLERYERGVKRAA